MTEDEAAEVEFTSGVAAREMRFERVPWNRVDFTARPDHASESGSERHHLPDAVSPHVRYSDVRVDYKIISKLRLPPRWWTDEP